MPSGGTRPGAGSPANLAKSVQEARQVARLLNEALKTGLKGLAHEYDTLVAEAIRIAKNGDTQMLKFLIELPTKLVRLESDEETPFQRMLKDLGPTKEVHLHQHIEGGKEESGSISITAGE